VKAVISTPGQKINYTFAATANKHVTFQVTQFKAPALIRRPHQQRLGFAQPDRRSFPYRTADLIYILIMEDSKQPGAQIRSIVPEVEFGQSTGQTILYEIVGSNGVASQCAGVTPQARNLGFDLAMKVIQGSISAVAIGRCADREVDDFIERL